MDLGHETAVHGRLGSATAARSSLHVAANPSSNWIVGLHPLSRTSSKQVPLPLSHWRLQSLQFEHPFVKVFDYTVRVAVSTC